MVALNDSQIWRYDENEPLSSCQDIYWSPANLQLLRWYNVLAGEFRETSVTSIGKFRGRAKVRISESYGYCRGLEWKSPILYTIFSRLSSKDLRKRDFEKNLANSPSAADFDQPLGIHRARPMCHHTKAQHALGGLYRNTSIRHNKCSLFTSISTRKHLFKEKFSYTCNLVQEKPPRYKKVLTRCYYTLDLLLLDAAMMQISFYSADELLTYFLRIFMNIFTRIHLLIAAGEAVHACVIARKSSERSHGAQRLFHPTICMSCIYAKRTSTYDKLQTEAQHQTGTRLVCGHT